jgi:transglutaminase-like putative cysteine protease
MNLMERIHATFTFDPQATTITTPVSRVLALGQGVCQDFAHLQIAGLRALGLPARYVSGYLLTNPPPGQPRLQGADASHAWLAVFCPEHGWVDLDPTNDLVPDYQHITLGWGRDYGDVSPVRGVVVGGGKHILQVGVSVTPQEDAGASSS